jgi:hypothetical protein
VAARPPLPLTQIRPPSDSTIDLLIAKPMALPCGFVVRLWDLKLGRVYVRKVASRSRSGWRWAHRRRNGKCNCLHGPDDAAEKLSSHRSNVGAHHLS